jgi:hypothetical protein
MKELISSMSWSRQVPYSESLGLSELESGSASELGGWHSKKSSDLEVIVAWHGCDEKVKSLHVRLVGDSALIAEFS